MGWSPAILIDQPRGSPSGQDHSLTLPEPLEAVNALKVLDQFSLCVDYDETLAADRERKLGREGEQAARDAPELLGASDIPWVRLQKSYLDMVLVPFQREQTENRIRNHRINDPEDLYALNRRAPGEPPTRPYPLEVVRLNRTNVCRNEAACLDVLDHQRDDPRAYGYFNEIGHSRRPLPARRRRWWEEHLSRGRGSGSGQTRMESA
jgi:hypothetical protein